MLCIKDKSDAEKIDFIESCIATPCDFQPIPNSNKNKILKNKNGENRDWLLIENNKFYCSYCLCFSSCSTDRLNKGIEYAKGCRIAEALNRHENGLFHIRSKQIFHEKVEDNGTPKFESRVRAVLTIIVRIIIFIATHGKHDNYIFLFTKLKFLIY